MPTEIRHNNILTFVLHRVHFHTGQYSHFQNVLCLSFANDMSMDIDFYFAMGINFFIVTKKLLIMSLPNKISYYCVNWQKVLFCNCYFGWSAKELIVQQKKCVSKYKKYKQNEFVVLLRSLFFANNLYNGMKINHSYIFI